MNELPEGILEFPELRGYIWGWLSKYINNKNFDGNEQAIKSIDFYLDWFVDHINELEDIEMDNVNKPEHYTYGKYECIDVIKEITKDLKGEEAFCIGNAIKYLWRWKHKNGVEDIKKARWYLDKLIKEFEEPKEEFHKLGFRINAEGKKELIDPATNKVYTVDPDTFHKSNYVYQEQSEYLGDATNPNKCVATNKPNPDYTNKNAPRPVYQLDSEMNVIKRYESIHAAIKDHSNKGVGYAVRHGTRCNGYYWKYAD